MLNITTGEQMRQRDREAMAAGIPGVVLMENAGMRVVEAVRERLSLETKGIKVTVLCGKGNNGGDGFVVARHLRRLGAEVKAFAFAPAEAYKGDAATNLDIWLHSGGSMEYILEERDLDALASALAGSDLAVDALLGTGLTRPVEGPMSGAIGLLNETRCKKVSVDIPSGVDSDRGQVLGAAVWADMTVTFAMPKRGLFLYPGAAYTGRLVIGDICFPPQVADKPTGVRLFTGEDAARLMPTRPADAHKGSSGRVVIVAGSPGYTGAAVLAAMASQRGGAGLTYLMTPHSLQPLVATKLTEVIPLPLAEDESGGISLKGAEAFLQLADKANAIAIGPGLGRGEGVKKFLAAVLPRLKVPAVIDADALNAMAEDKGLLGAASAPLVLTPHPGEMSRLTGLSPEEIQGGRVEVACSYAREWGVTLVLKGTPTVTAFPGGEAVINSSGSAALATAGTGDVLTGLLSALLARGLHPSAAVPLGVYLHGLAGEEAEHRRGGGVIAGDVVEALGAWELPNML